MKSTLLRILVVEDDPGLAFGLQTFFESSGYAVGLAPDGKSALMAAAADKPHLVILDLMLPDMNGLEVLSNLRNDFPVLPIIILSARSAEPDRVAGLKRGADDYVTKPFSVAELELRVQRHIGARSASSVEITNGDSKDDVILDRARRVLWRKGKEVRLTAKEFDLLHLLMLNEGCVLNREDILRLVWNYPPTMETRTLDQHIARLRNKIEADPHAPKHIVTVPRVGFVFIK